MAEVSSPNQFRPEMFDKVKVYLGAGVQLVWVIWPARQQVDVWLPPIPAADQPAAQLSLAIHSTDFTSSQDSLIPSLTSLLEADGGKHA